jgi:hypothetical protein
MRRVFMIAAAGMGLAGCSSFSLDSFKSEPPTVQLALESIPSGAEARTSTGQSCKTPCSVAVTASDAGFSVSFALSKFHPETVPVQVINIPGDFTTPASIKIEPNPVIAELKPVGPPPKAVRARPKKKPKPAAAPAAGSPFPDPSAPPPPSR